MFAIIAKLSRQLMCIG